MLEIIIDGECVAQSRPRMTRTGHVFTPAKSRAYREKVKAEAIKAMGGRLPTLLALSCEIIIVRGIPTSWSKKKRREALEGLIKPIVKSDIDNYSKMLLDGMNGIVYKDDCQIVRLVAEKIYGVKPCAIIRIKPVF